jgi:hypothetical protein
MNAIPLINNAPRPNINVGSIGSPAFNPVAAGAKLGGSIGGNVMRQNPASMPVNNETQLRQEVNTSIVALKREAFSLENLIAQAAQTLQDINKRLSELEGKQGDYVKKNDVVDSITSGNMNPLTSNAVATSNAMPVNSVTSGNMHSVTSNAVASEITDIKTPIYLNTYTTTGSNLTLSNDIDIYKCLYFKVLINGVVVNTYLCLTTDKNTVFTIKYITDNNTQAIVSFSFNKTKISITVSATNNIKLIINRSHLVRQLFFNLQTHIHEFIIYCKMPLTSLLNCCQSAGRFNFLYIPGI